MQQLAANAISSAILGMQGMLAKVVMIAELLYRITAVDKMALATNHNLEQ